MQKTVNREVQEIRECGCRVCFLIILHIFSVKWCKSGVNLRWFWCTEWCKSFLQLPSIFSNFAFTIPLRIKLLNFIPHTLVVHMIVYFHGNCQIAVPHNLLQRPLFHPCLCHSGASSMPQNMCRNVWQKLWLPVLNNGICHLNAVIIIYNPVKYNIQLCSTPKLESLCKEHKTTVGIHHKILQHSML